MFDADVHERRRSRQSQQLDRRTATDLAELRGVIADLRSDALDQLHLARALALAERHPRDCAEIEAEFDRVGRAGPRLHDLWVSHLRSVRSDVDAVRSALITYVTSCERLYPLNWAAFAEVIGVNRPGALAPLILGGAIAPDDEKRKRLIAQINHAAHDPAILARADAHLRALYSDE